MRKIGFIISAVVFGFLLYYFFLKSYDYLVTIKVKTSVGTINQSLKLWNSNLDYPSSLNQNALNHLTQQIEINDSIHRYDWKIKVLNDSTSEVKVYIKDKKHSFHNKITIPFSETHFEKRIAKTITDFSEKLNEHLESFKISITSIGKTPETYCAYVSMKSLQIEKARGMMQNYSFLSNFLFEGNVTMNGTPFVEITNWNRENDSINYNFCFPIIYNDSLPKHKLISYKESQSTKALKAIYNGNYITSDRAWYALLDYAKRKSINVKDTPVEVFYNNPNFGGDELLWKAEIFMPLKEQK